MCIKRIMNKFDKKMKGLVLKIFKTSKGRFIKQLIFLLFDFIFKDDELFV